MSDKPLKILLTGGSGDLGRLLAKQFELRGDVPVRLDVRPPSDRRGVYIAGSILDRATLAPNLATIDAVVHIAAWHGIHEVTGQRDVYDFWDLNVTGTFNLFEAAAQAGVRKVVFISSTSAAERASIYGHTKVLGEEIARTYAARHQLHVITLRPRAFVPHWNREVYADFVAWAKWFWRGAVHIDDVVQAVVKSVDRLVTAPPPEPLVLTIDGAYEYSDDDLRRWDQDGPASSFRRHYARYEALAREHGLDLRQPPVKLDISAARRWIDYEPRYSLRNLLEELEKYGPAGPPAPDP